MTLGPQQLKAGSLLHTDPSGTIDLPDSPFTRNYLISSHQHGVGNGTVKGVCQQFLNPLEIVGRLPKEDPDVYRRAKPMRARRCLCKLVLGVITGSEFVLATLMKTGLIVQRSDNSQLT